MNHATSSILSGHHFSVHMTNALRQIGVSPETLSDAQRLQLDDQGFLLLPGMMPPALLAEFRHVHERLMSLKYPDPSLPTPPLVDDRWNHEPGTRRIADLVSQDPLYDCTYTNPSVLAAVSHILGRDFKLHSLNARDALPGSGIQDFHRDGYHPPGSCNLVNSAWLLDGFTLDNGSTRVIPGSHSHREQPTCGLDAHPDQVVVTAEAGSVLVFRGDLLHSGTTNLSGQIRRVFHVAFCLRKEDIGVHDQNRLIRKSTWERISPEARWILNVAAQGP